MPVTAFLDFLAEGFMVFAETLGRKCHVYFLARWTDFGLSIDSSEIS